MTNATRAMPVTATTVFFPMEELSHNQPGQGPDRAEADDEVIMVERSGFLEKNAPGRNLLIQERPHVFYGGHPTSDVIFDSNQSEREKFRQ